MTLSSFETPEMKPDDIDQFLEWFEDSEDIISKDYDASETRAVLFDLYQHEIKLIEEKIRNKTYRRKNSSTH